MREHAPRDLMEMSQKTRGNNLKWIQNGNQFVARETFRVKLFVACIYIALILESTLAHKFMIDYARAWLAVWTGRSTHW